MTKKEVEILKRIFVSVEQGDLGILQSLGILVISTCQALHLLYIYPCFRRMILET